LLGDKKRGHTASTRNRIGRRTFAARAEQRHALLFLIVGVADPEVLHDEVKAGKRESGVKGNDRRAGTYSVSAAREQLVVCVGWQSSCQCYESGRRSVGRYTTSVSLNPLATLSLDHSYFSAQEYKPEIGTGNLTNGATAKAQENGVNP